MRGTTAEGPGTSETALAEDRRRHVLRSAALVIAERGLSGATMRVVARRAGASTGMLTHYFSGRADILMRTLEFVSETMQLRASRAIEGVEAGESRLRAFLKASLPYDVEAIQAWRVWIAAYAEAAHSPVTRQLIGWRHELWWKIHEEVLEGLPLSQPVGAQWSTQLNAFVMGLVIQDMTSDAVELRPEQMEAAVVSFITAGLETPAS